jgi:hypothetical protein
MAAYVGRKGGKRAGGGSAAKATPGEGIIGSSLAEMKTLALWSATLLPPSIHCLFPNAVISRQNPMRHPALSSPASNTVSGEIASCMQQLYWLAQPY